MKHEILVDDEGYPIAVLRPTKPALAVALAKTAAAKNDKALFDQIPEAVGDYTMVGWLTKGPNPCVVDRDGHRIDDIQAGDSFVTLKDPVS